MGTYNEANAKLTWKYLKGFGYSDAGVAGIMGNLSVEGSFDPLSIENDYLYVNKTINGKSITQFKQEYAQKINSGAIGRDQFSLGKYSDSHPLGNSAQKGYGLAGWTFYTIKQGLWDYVHQGRDISKLTTQIGFLQLTMTSQFCKNYGINAQIATLPSYLKSATNIAEATKKFHDIYEGPIQGSLQRRIDEANGFYNKYRGEKSLKLSDNVEAQMTGNVDEKKSNLVRIARAEGEKHIQGTPNKYTQWYGMNAAWCCMFVMWCCNQAQIEVPIKTAGCKTLADAAVQQGKWVEPEQLLAGDLVIFQSPKYQYQHVGVVLEDYNSATDSIVTAEGNTSIGSSGSQAMGNGTAVKTRKVHNNTFWVRGGVRLGDGVAAQSRGADYSTEDQQPSFNLSWLKDFATKLAEVWKSPTGGTTTQKKQRTVSYETKVSTVRKDIINTVDADANSLRAKGQSLLTLPSYVESPFVILKVGQYTFGSYNRSKGITKWEVQYPNFITGLSVTKVNGTVNQYTINMTYQIEVGNDPNFIDKIFSTIGYGIVKISYGDWMVPNFIYKEEEAIITKVTTQVDFSHAKINYTINCTSNALSLLSSVDNFPKVHDKPSSVIKKLLTNKKYGLQDIFYGMKTNSSILQLLAQDDQAVDIPAKTNIDVFSYINFLVTCMRSSSSSGNLNDSSYYLTLSDDVLEQFGGPYFKITKVSNNINVINLNQMNTYTVDVGFPGDTPVINFSLKNDNSWSLLYDYNEKISPQQYKYSIDNSGKIHTESSPSIMISDQYNKPMPTQRSWWTKMTQFPINAELTIKGLLRPAMLMTYVRINAFFYGQRHTASGLYIITQQRDSVTGNGYRTTLQLTRVAGDLDYMETKYDTVEYKVPVYTEKVVVNDGSVEDIPNWAETKKNTAT